MLAAWLSPLVPFPIKAFLTLISPEVSLGAAMLALASVLAFIVGVILALWAVKALLAFVLGSVMNGKVEAKWHLGD